ncbi:MAG: hypothetical protein ACJ75Z_00465 [Solirubrobacterales bacterium]
MSADVKRVRVVLETESYRIVGDVSLPAEGYRGRLSDLLNREGIEFISLKDALVSGRNGTEPEERPFIAVARDHVQLAYEAD